MICGLWKRGTDETGGLAAMLAALPGTAADVEATWADGRMGLGCRRWAAGEEDRAERLPRFDAGSGLAIVASARLDGRAALRDALDIPGPQRAGLPDSELILRAWRRWGRECPNRLLGDYAFAVWDSRNETLFCARDHIGVRPFYYSMAAGRFAFASDIDAVLAAPGVPHELDEAAVATWLTHGARPPGALTFYRAVRKLPPGHALTVERGATRVERWWRPEDAPLAAPASDAEHAEAFLDLYAEAIGSCVRGARHVGVHLSGGLDSSSIAVLGARELRRRGRPPPPAFCWQPPPGEGSRSAAEHGAIEAVCRQEGLRPFYLAPCARDVVAFLRGDLTRGADESSLLHEEVVQRCAAGQGVRVLLSGWGGDEGVSFNGRGHYPQLLASGRVTQLWREVREWSPHPVLSIVAHAALPLVSPGAAARLKELRRGVRKRGTFIHPDFARRTALLPAQSWRPLGVRRTQLSLWRRGHLSWRMEGWAASGARRGIEYRYPLLDRRLLEFALSLPPDRFRRGRWSRWLMRRGLVSVLPPGIRWHPGKEDPVRLGAFYSALAEALPAVRRILDARVAPPSRSRYLDMPRLLAELDADRLRAGARPGPIMNALQFLDF